MASSTDYSRNSRNKFPSTLLEFGYEFNDEGKLRNVKTGEGFQFVVKEGDKTYNQLHYEALGEVITEEVYKLLETDCKLRRAPVPHDSTDEDNRTFIFLSEDALTNPERLLILIHGSGVVRAGQWSRRLIINDSLKVGTQIPFIQEAQKKGYGIVVTNTNDNYTRNKQKIQGSEKPEVHALHVWNHYIRGAKARHIGIIAHSYGGCVVTSLYRQVKEEFKKRVFAVAMTDSVHHISDRDTYKSLVKISKNWVCSDKPLDSPEKTNRGDVQRVSAGVNVHEKTSWSSFNSIFEFLRVRLKTAECEEEVEESPGEASQYKEQYRDDDDQASTSKQEEAGHEGKKMKMSSST